MFMLFFWKRYQESKLASFVSFLASIALYFGALLTVGGIGVFVTGSDSSGLAGALAGIAALGLFFLLRKGAEKIAER